MRRLTRTVPEELRKRVVVALEAFLQHLEKKEERVGGKGGRGDELCPPSSTIQHGSRDEEGLTGGGGGGDLKRSIRAKKQSESQRELWQTVGRRTREEEMGREEALA